MAEVVSPPTSPILWKRDVDTGMSETDIQFVKRMPQVEIDSAFLDAFAMEAESAVNKNDFARLELMFAMLAANNVTKNAQLIATTTHIAPLARELVVSDSSTPLLKKMAALVCLQVKRGLQY